VRIVLDTNIVLSELLWQGTPYHLLVAIRQRPGTQLYSSTALHEELADALTRASAAKRVALIGKSAREVLADYVEATGLVEPVDVPRVVAGATDDDQVIAAAVAARANLIVSATDGICCPSAAIKASPLWRPPRLCAASPPERSRAARTRLWHRAHPGMQRLQRGGWSVLAVLRAQALGGRLNEVLTLGRAQTGCADWARQIGGSPANRSAVAWTLARQPDR